MILRRIGREEFGETNRLLKRLYNEGLMFPTGLLGEAYIGKVARATILALLPLVIRQHAPDHGLSSLVPVTDHSDLYTAVSRTLDLPPFRRTGDVLQVHMRAVALDTTEVSLDDLMSFRIDHYSTFLKYMRTVEEVTRRIGELDPAERTAALTEHEEEVTDSLKDLQEAAGSWGRPVAGLTLGLTGAAWAATHGADPVGGVLAGLGALIGFSRPGHAETEFSYLFEVERSFSRSRRPPRRRRPPPRPTPIILVEKNSRPRGSSREIDYGDWID